MLLEWTLTIIASVFGLVAFIATFIVWRHERRRQAELRKYRNMRMYLDGLITRNVQ